MTTPTPAPAPMTLPERLRAIRFSSNPDDYDAITIEAAAEIDALTARVATLESELAAARKVEDGEVEKRLKSLAAMHHHLGYSHTLDHVDRENIKKAMDLLTRLSAALKEAERRETEAKTLQHQLASDLTVAVARAQAAEAKLETARRDALEEAALELDRHPDANGSRYIRALQDTRHD